MINENSIWQPKNHDLSVGYLDFCLSAASMKARKKLAWLKTVFTPHKILSPSKIFDEHIHLSLCSIVKSGWYVSLQKKVSLQCFIQHNVSIWQVRAYILHWIQRRLPDYTDTSDKLASDSTILPMNLTQTRVAKKIRWRT